MPKNEEVYMLKGKIKIVDFDIRYLDEATELFINNYKEAIEYPLLPRKYGERDMILNLLGKYIERNNGVVALIDNTVVGYLTGEIISNFKGSGKGVYTPEWGHGARTTGKDTIYKAMYNRIVSIWHDLGCVVHAITNLGYDSKLSKQWFWMGYGLLVVDAVKDLNRDFNISEPQNINIRMARENDRTELRDILEEHLEYMSSSPTFLYTGKINLEEEIDQWFDDQQRVIWVAESNDEILGYLHTVSNVKNACTLVRDEMTLSIQDTQVKEKFSGLGVGSALLNKVVQYAMENQYERLSVDFESANDRASGFWLKHFQPVCYSLIRHIDDRSVQKGETKCLQN